MLELQDSLLALQNKPTGQSLAFIEHTVPELLMVFEGSTQCERTIHEVYRDAWGVVCSLISGLFYVGGITSAQ